MIKQYKMKSQFQKMISDAQLNLSMDGDEQSYYRGGFYNKKYPTSIGTPKFSSHQFNNQPNGNYNNIFNNILVFEERVINYILSIKKIRLCDKDEYLQSSDKQLDSNQ